FGPRLGASSRTIAAPRRASSRVCSPTPRLGPGRDQSEIDGPCQRMIRTRAVLPRGWRRAVARSNHPLATALRAVVKAPEKLSVPVPRVVAVPVLWGYLAGRSVIHFARRVFIAEPLFRAYVTERGEGLHTGIYVHWIEGVGDIIVGDNVMFDGQS